LAGLEARRKVVCGSALIALLASSVALSAFGTGDALSAGRDKQASSHHRKKVVAVKHHNVAAKHKATAKHHKVAAKHKATHHKVTAQRHKAKTTRAVAHRRHMIDP